MALSAELDLLRESLSCCTYRGDQHSDVLIEEHDAQAKLKKVTLLASNGDWFSFDPDKGRGPKKLMSPLLTTGNAHDHHRACDCVVLIRRDGKLTAIYIDLKSSNPKRYSGQFKSTRQFLQYAVRLIEEFHGQSLQLDDERYVVLYGGKPALLQKTVTAPKPPKVGKTQPDNPYRREVTNPGCLYLAELLR